MTRRASAVLDGVNPNQIRERQKKPKAKTKKKQQKTLITL